MSSPTRARREQFYEDIDEGTKAEFINGEIVVHSPARKEHLDVSAFVVNLMMNHVASRKLGKVYIEKCLIRCERNDYEPDICYFAVEKTSALKGGQNIFPPPDLIVEILSPSTAGNDRKISACCVQYCSEWTVTLKTNRKLIERSICTRGDSLRDRGHPARKGR